MNFDILWRCALTMVVGWFIGFLSTRHALKEKYKNRYLNPVGVLKLVYDQDDPGYPKMGLEIESLSYILMNDYVMLHVIKKGFPNSDKKVYLESSKDKSA